MLTLLKLADSDIRAFFESLQARTEDKCCICKKVFTQADLQSGDIHQMKKGQAHGDCYFADTW